MYTWLSTQIGSGAANLVVAIVALLIVIALIFLVVSTIRRLTAGVYVAGGKKRIPRLAIHDAAAIDKTRRLVLVCRDNVEHLILIGGPTDLVIETNIPAEYARNNNERSHKEAQAAHTAAKKHEATRKEPELNVDEVAVAHTPAAPQFTAEPSLASELEQYEEPRTEDYIQEPEAEQYIQQAESETEQYIQQTEPEHYIQEHETEQYVEKDETEQYIQEPAFSSQESQTEVETISTEYERAITSTASSSARLHPTYPLKQVSEGIYSGRSTRTENDIPSREKPLNLRIENPYRKTPQQPISSEEEMEADVRNDPQFEDELHAVIKKDSEK